MAPEKEVAHVLLATGQATAQDGDTDQGAQDDHEVEGAEGVQNQLSGGASRSESARAPAQPAWGDAG